MHDPSLLCLRPRLKSARRFIIAVMAVNINLGQYFRFLAAFLPDFTSAQARRKHVYQYICRRAYIDTPFTLCWFANLLVLSSDGSCFMISMFPVEGLLVATSM